MKKHYFQHVCCCADAKIHFSIEWHELCEFSYRFTIINWTLGSNCYYFLFVAAAFGLAFDSFELDCALKILVFD